MTEPVSTSVATYFSLVKIWSIVAGVCGSIIPILALADRTRISTTNGIFMALTGSSFSIFVGPWMSEKLGFTSLEGVVALSWIMGASGVFVVRAFIKWLENEGTNVVSAILNKIAGPNKIPEPDSDVKQDNPPHAS
jgi:hypothetical protein